ncbi:MAG: SH3 domain-containing protein [Polyangiaceae bacterium]
MAKEDAPLTVKIPAPSEDRAISSKVGIIAVVGFAVGVLWPRLLNYKVGPTPPESESRVVAAQTANASASASAAAPQPSTPDVADVGDEPPKVTNKETVIVSPGQVVGCVNKKKENVSDCGPFAFDRYVSDKLAAVGDCAFAIGQKGDYSVSLNVNFDEKKPTITVSEGKVKSTFGTMASRGLLKCTQDELKGVELDKIPHTHTTYRVEYKLSFYPPGVSPEDPKDTTDPSGDKNELGNATVVVSKAIVRDKPEREKGKQITKLPQGTHVKILRQDKDWYEIESGKIKGWVHRQAIGK